MPRNLADRDVFVLDPMLATGSSELRARAAGNARSKGDHVRVFDPREGIATINAAHPDVRIVTASIDERLNDHGYIMGLGDAGDHRCSARRRRCR